MPRIFFRRDNISIERIPVSRSVNLSISKIDIAHVQRVLGKLGPGRLGPGKLGPSPIWRQIGPRTFWGPICHFLANRAPADWAPWWQIGPRQIGPRQIGPLGGKLGPLEILSRQIGPRKSLGAADWAPWRQIGPLVNFVYGWLLTFYCLLFNIHCLLYTVLYLLLTVNC